MSDHNLFNQTKIEQTFQGRKVFQGNFKQVPFQEFIESISDPEEWYQWKTFVEGELVTTNVQMEKAIQTLKPNNVFVVDQPNKIMHFMNKETFNYNLDKRKEN
jgi:hypothetical protein